MGSSYRSGGHCSMVAPLASRAVTIAWSTSLERILSSRSFRLVVAAPRLWAGDGGWPACSIRSAGVPVRIGWDARVLHGIVPVRQPSGWFSHSFTWWRRFASRRMRERSAARATGRSWLPTTRRGSGPSSRLRRGSASGARRRRRDAARGARQGDGDAAERRGEGTRTAGARVRVVGRDGLRAVTEWRAVGVGRYRYRALESARSSARHEGAGREAGLMPGNENRHRGRGRKAAARGERAWRKTEFRKASRC